MKLSHRRLITLLFFEQGVGRMAVLARSSPGVGGTGQNCA